MNKLTVSIILFLAVGLTALGVYFLLRPDQRLVVRANASVSEALGGAEDTGFARVLYPRNFSFPEDHGPHPDYGIEWWYYTGNLDSEEGRHFGFELTLFRIGLAPGSPNRSSQWAASQLYMGHFAVTDVDDRQFYAFERFSRQALGLAGASAEDDGTFRVWLEDWSIEGEGTTQPTVRLRAAEENIAIELTLVSDKPLVLQGNRGYSRKSAEQGNASYYYSITRLPTTGTISIAGQSFAVRGTSWMDREWSTSALSEQQEGWDWFALQLSDGRDLMFYQIRLKDGGIDPLSSGTVISGDGSIVAVSADSVNIQVLDQWESPRGVSYPVEWQMEVPSRSIDLRLTSYIKDQELDLSVAYWEGAVKISGTSQGKPVTGSGYVEMTRPRGP